jgi:plasmid replication initiation protein
MTSKPGPGNKSSTVLDVTSGFDELNLGRLTLNSAQKTVPADMRRWEKSILTPDGRPVIVVCAVEEGEVVPHGLDNDFMVGLINLCFEAGVPSGPFTITGYALLKAAGLPDTAQYYRSMQESLKRLSKAKYSVDEAWYARDSGEWLSQEFSQISYLAYRRSTGGMTARATISVQLGVPILDSLRAGYIKPLDLELYRSLSQPLVRALYRQLDALHFDETTEDGLSKEVMAPLLAWAVRLGLFSDRPDNIVRALKPAHDELLKRNYLMQVEVSGRGRDKSVRYVFAGPPRSDHPELAASLMDRGVKKGMALRLSAAFPDRIPEALRRFEHYLKVSKTPISNPGGLLVAMIKSPEHYEDIPGYGVERNVTAPARKAKVDLQHEETLVREAETSRELQLAAMQGPELQAWVLQQLGLFGLLKHLSVAERATLGDAVGEQRIDGRQLVKQGSKAVLKGAAGLLALAEDIRLHL